MRPGPTPTRPIRSSCSARRHERTSPARVSVKTGWAAGWSLATVRVLGAAEGLLLSFISFFTSSRYYEPAWSTGGEEGGYARYELTDMFMNVR